MLRQTITLFAAIGLLAGSTVLPAVAQDKMDDKKMDAMTMTEKRMMMDRMQNMTASEKKLMMRAMEIMARMSPAERQQMMGMMGGGMMAMDDKAMSPLSPAMIRKMLTSWPEKSREVASTVMTKYGPPAEATAHRLTWYNTGPWKRTVVWRDPIMHHFPVPHPDLLEQFIDYQVPPAKFSDLAMYDGSVIVERTKGEISARCDKEGANFLAINLAHDILTGKKSVEEARAFYAMTIKAVMAGEKPAYTQKFQFDPPKGDTKDPDKPAMAGP